VNPLHNTKINEIIKKTPVNFFFSICLILTALRGFIRVVLGIVLEKGGFR